MARTFFSCARMDVGPRHGGSDLDGAGMAKWNHEPTTAQVRDRLAGSIHEMGTLYAAMVAGLETSTEQYPNGDTALTIIAQLMLGSGKPVEEMGPRDFEAIGAQIAEWFRQELEAIARGEARAVRRRLDDKAIEIMTGRDSVAAHDRVSRCLEARTLESQL